MYMFIKLFNSALGAILLSLSTSICFGEIIHVDKAIETETFQVFHATPTGIIVARECKTCPELRLTTNTNTQAIHNGKSVSITSVPTLANNTITVIYDPQTNIAKKILW